LEKLHTAGMSSHFHPAVKGSDESGNGAHSDTGSMPSCLACPNRLATLSYVLVSS
jgi:hypothetical protein